MAAVLKKRALAEYSQTIQVNRHTMTKTQLKNKILGEPDPNEKIAINKKGTTSSEQYFISFDQLFGKLQD